MKIARLLPPAVAILTILLVVAASTTLDIHDEIASAAGQTLFVHPGESVGQSFIARHAGLQGVDVYINGESSRLTNAIRLNVQASDQAGAPIVRVVSETNHPVKEQGWHRMGFAPIGESRNQRFFVTFSTGQGEPSDIALRSAPGGAYRDGALYLAGVPQDAQLAIRLHYNPWYIALDLAAWLVQAVLICLLALVVFVLPGLALQAYLLPLPGEAWQTKLGVAAGLSLCVYPLVLVWADVAGLRPGIATVALPIGIATAALVWRAWRQRTRINSQATVRGWWGGALRTPDILFIVVVALVVLVRLFLLRSMDAPMWGDSVQHSMIGQLIVDNGGLFSSWRPYVPYDSLTVHPGFHVVIAVLMWATGSPVLAATSLAGQLVNILAVLALVPLAQRITRSPWAGIGVVVAAGLFAPLPNGYLNWGRYPQLMGQAIAPVAMWLVWRMLDGEYRAGRRSICLAGIAFAGTFLAYYRMPHYVAIFALTVALWRRGWKGITALGVSALSALLLVLPWLLRLRGSALGEGVDAVTLQPSSIDAILADYRSLAAMAEPLLGGWLIAATLVVIVVAFAARRKAMIVITLWGIGLLCLPAVRLIRLPGFNNLWVFAVLISLYIPMGLLLGVVIDGLLSRTRTMHPWVNRGLVALVLIAATLGALDRLRVYDPRYRILAPADIHAMGWVREHLSPDARIVVDGFLVYDGRSAVGSDGGWWIPLLTSRQTTMPPQYPLIAEHPVDPAYNDEVVDLTTQIRKAGIASNEGLAVLCRYGITHLYIGEERGSVAMPVQTPMLPVTELNPSSAFTVLYREDRVAVFQFDRTLCH